MVKVEEAKEILRETNFIKLKMKIFVSERDGGKLLNTDVKDLNEKIAERENLLKIKKRGEKRRNYLN